MATEIDRLAQEIKQLKLALRVVEKKMENHLIMSMRHKWFVNAIKRQMKIAEFEFSFDQEKVIKLWIEKWNMHEPKDFEKRIGLLLKRYNQTFKDNKKIEMEDVRLMEQDGFFEQIDAELAKSEESESEGESEYESEEESEYESDESESESEEESEYESEEESEYESEEESESEEEVKGRGKVSFKIE